MPNSSLLARSFMVILVVAATFAATPAQAQSWSGIIDPSRAIDWSQAGVVGGIPTNATQCGATLTSITSNATINNAIANCTGASASTPKYVLIGAGTFTIGGSITINKNYVSLRGQGPTSTIIKITGFTCGIFGAGVCVGEGGGGEFLGNPNCVLSQNGCIHSWATSWTGTATGGAGTYTKGDTRLIVASTANMAVGRLIELDQLDDTSDDGGITNSSQTGVFSTEGVPNFGRIMTSEGSLNRTQHQVVRVTNIVDSTHVDITPGIYMPNWRTSRTPMVASWGTADSHFSFGNGLESLSIVNSGVASTGQNGIIHVEDCYNCWIKNVRSIIGPRDHVNFIQSAHSEVRDSYFYGSTGVGAESYGIECTGASDILVINNIFHRLTAPELSPCAGSVDAYNYAYDNFFAPGGGCTDVGGNVGNCNWATHWGTHDSGGGMRLIEGNQNNGFLTDFPHGNSPLYTLFRNAFNGIDDSGSKNSYRRAIVLSAFSRGYNIVGNVLGTTGAGFSYQEASPQCCDDMYIYNLGQGSGLSGGNDARVASSLLRWGNYDTATGTTRFVASEVPTTGIPRINGNPVPANQNLPKSFFLASQPSFWGTPWGNPPWPAVGPDVTGGNGPGGHSYDIPAKLCFTHLSNDPAFPSATPAVKMFDGANCYTGSATAPPTVSISIQ